MADEPFEKMDESLMKDFKALREKEIPREIMKGFSTSVEREILKKQDQKVFRPGWFRKWTPVFVPALGVLVIVVGSILLKGPLLNHVPVSSNTSLPLALSVVSDLSEEIQALEELGVWTEADDRAVDPTLAEF